jgi:DNA polymerase-3 subunit epsilon
MLVERVDPGLDIPEAATKVHGIRTEEVRGLFGKPKLARIGARLLEFLGDADVGGFNVVAFDLPLFQTDLRRHGLGFDLAGRHVVDAKTIFHRLETNWDRFLMGPRNLSAAVRIYCGRELEGKHSAGADAAAALDVLLAQLRRYPELPRSVPALDAFCRQAVEAVEPRR